MSVFYGTIEGNRGYATKCGSRNSGFRASAQSYDGSVICCLDYNNKDELIVRVGTNDSSSCYTDCSGHEFRGTFEEFKNALTLVNDIKSGRVSVVRHRKR